MRPHLHRTFAALLHCAATLAAADPADTVALPTLREQLKAAPFKIVHESYIGFNWELCLIDADGAAPQNLTRSFGIHELYPQVDPAGSRILFLAESGRGRATLRTLHLLELATGKRTRIADHAREGFWHPNGIVAGLLPQEHRRFDAAEFFSSGLNLFNSDTGALHPHPASADLRHLYCASFTHDGAWILATIQGDSGSGHGISLISSSAGAPFHLGIPGCRAVLSPDGRSIAWNRADNELCIAPVAWSGETPVVGDARLSIIDNEFKLYHADWSPDGRFLAFSRGPAGFGDTAHPGTHIGPAEVIGVFAEGWDICAASAEHTGIIDLQSDDEELWAQLTFTGASNKEPAWFTPAPRPLQSLPPVSERQ